MSRYVVIRSSGSYQVIDKEDKSKVVFQSDTRQGARNWARLLHGMDKRNKQQELDEKPLTPGA